LPGPAISEKGQRKGGLGGWSLARVRGGLNDKKTKPGKWRQKRMGAVGEKKSDGRSPDTDSFVLPEKT